MIWRRTRLDWKGCQTATKSLPKVTATSGVVITARFHVP